MSTQFYAKNRIFDFIFFAIIIFFFVARKTIAKTQKAKARQPSAQHRLDLAKSNTMSIIANTGSRAKSKRTT